jgi:dipeptide/tripeptide permease
MGVRRVITLVFLPLVMLLDRFAFYGGRSYLTMHLMDQGMSRHDAAMTWSGIHGILLIAPLIGGLVAMVTSPRWTLFAGTVMAAGAHTLIATVPGSLVTGALVLLMLGEGFVRPTVFALIARELGDPRQTARAGVMVAAYAAVNLGAFAGPEVARLIARAFNGSAVFTAMGMTGFGPIVLSLVIALLPRLMQDDPPPVEKPGAFRGTLILLGLFAPAMLGMTLIEDLGYLTLAGEHPTWLYWLNPVVATVGAGAAALAILVLGVVPVKWSLTWPIVAGFFMMVLAGLVIMVGDDHAPLTLGSGAVLASLAEVLLTPFILALATSGLPDQRTTLIVGGWLACTHALGYLGTLITSATLAIPAIAVLVACSAGAGVLLLVKRDLLNRSETLPPRQ